MIFHYTIKHGLRPASMTLPRKMALSQGQAVSVLIFQKDDP